MQYKEILFKDDARKKLLRGVNVVADAVVSTLGPKGANAIFEEGMYPVITKDGVTVAQQVFLEDRFENMGAIMAREAAENTNREAGDGTTTTVALLRSIVNEGNKYLVSGMNPILLKRGMDQAVDDVVIELDKIKKTITTDIEKEQVATISANNDPILGKLIADVIKEVGKDGVITVTNSNILKNEVEYVKGTKIDSGYESHMFINDRKRLAADIDKPIVIITTDKVSLQSHIIKLIDNVVTAGKREMVLFADAIDGQALAFLTQNHLLGKFTCVPVKFQSFGDYQKDLMYDLATLTGATVVGDDCAKNLNDARLEDCGVADNIIITRGWTIIRGGSGDVSKRIDEVKALMENEKDVFKTEQLKKRLGKLTGSIANIKVGGASETEQAEIKYRIEDAINSTKSAIEDGIVEGGGTALLRISELLNKHNRFTDDFGAGYSSVIKSLKDPAKTIINNAGLPADAIISDVLKGNGYNVLTDTFENLIDAGVIDPVRCVKNEIINATATASILLTSTVAIINRIKKDE
jgi:chaperonin GroEL